MSMSLTHGLLMAVLVVLVENRRERESRCEAAGSNRLSNTAIPPRPFGSPCTVPMPMSRSVCLLFVFAVCVYYYIIVGCQCRCPRTMPTGNAGGNAQREREAPGAPALSLFIPSACLQCASFILLLKSISLKPNWPTKIRPDSLVVVMVLILRCASSVADRTNNGAASPHSILSLLHSPCVSWQTDPSQ